MLNRSLTVALLVLLLTAAGVRAQDDASPSPSPEPADAESPAPVASPEAAASPSPAASVAAPGLTSELEGTYAYDIDHVLEQIPDYNKFTPEKKKEAREKTVAGAPKLEIVISADRVKISENGVVRTDATYQLIKRNGGAFALELTNTLTPDKKVELVNFELDGAKLKMAKEGDPKDALYWVRTQ